MSVTTPNECSESPPEPTPPIPSRIGRLRYRCKFPSCNTSYYSNIIQKDYKNIRFHKFPRRDPDILALWRQICKIDPEINVRSFMICDNHFSASDYNNPRDPNSCLKIGTVPGPAKIKSSIDSISQNHFSVSDHNYPRDPNSSLETETVPCSAEISPSVDCSSNSVIIFSVSDDDDNSNTSSKAETVPSSEKNNPSNNNCSNSSIIQESSSVPDDNNSHEPNSSLERGRVRCLAEINPSVDCSSHSVIIFSVSADDDNSNTSSKTETVSRLAKIDSSMDGISNSSISHNHFSVWDHDYSRDPNSSSITETVPCSAKINPSTNCCNSLTNQNHSFVSDDNNPRHQNTSSKKKAVPPSPRVNLPNNCCHYFTRNNRFYVRHCHDPHDLNLPSKKGTIPRPKSPSKSGIGRLKYRCKFPSCNTPYYSEIVQEDYKNIRFHRFPRRPEVLAKWRQICRIDPQINVTNYFICDNHFSVSDLNNPRDPNSNLKIGTVPRQSPRGIKVVSFSPHISYS